MNLNDLQSQVALGEDSCRQFKRDVTNIDSLASEMAAFANSNEGVNHRIDTSGIHALYTALICYFSINVV